MNNQYILAIDQGTSSTKALLVDSQGNAIAKGTVPLKTFYLSDGFVEQDPESIYNNLIDAVKYCLSQFTSNGGLLSEIKSCGISNQRETFILWDKNGKPLHNAIVWQCKRSISICDRLKNEGVESEIKQKTGLIIDPYFSGTKLIWLLEHSPVVAKAIANKEVFFGTVDTWLLYKLTNGKSYFTDYTNASRTMLFNLHSLDWDHEIISKFGLNTLNLPSLKASSAHFGTSYFPDSTGSSLFDHPLSIDSMIGDSHAAAFGEGCFSSGMAKATLGTGCSILVNIGDKPKLSKHGMLTTICWSMDHRIDYALEGAIVSAGASLEWLKNELGLFRNNDELEKMAESVPDNGGVYLIPAFSGLGAPHWQMQRKASILGLTFGTNRNHILRAALESIAFQIKDVIDAMAQDINQNIMTISANGGITQNQFLIKYLVDLIYLPIHIQNNADISALGAAYLSGLQIGIFQSIETLKKLIDSKTMVRIPNVNNASIIKNYENWKKEIDKV